MSHKSARVPHLEGQMPQFFIESLTVEVAITGRSVTRIAQCALTTDKYPRILISFTRFVKGTGFLVQKYEEFGQN